MFGRMLIALVAIIWASNAASAQQPQCGPHAEVVKVLHEQYQEKREAMGLMGGTAMMETYVSEKGTWTVLVSRTDGISCLLAAGDNWERSTDAFKPGQGT